MNAEKVKEIFMILLWDSSLRYLVVLYGTLCVSIFVRELLDVDELIGRLDFIFCVRTNINTLSNHCLCSSEEKGFYYDLSGRGMCIQTKIFKRP